MSLLQKTESWGDNYLPVIARAEGLRSPMHVELDDTLYTQRIFAPGFFCGTHTVANRFRILPRTRITAINGNTLTVTPNTAGIFVVGEVLTGITATGTAGGAVGTIQSFDVNANTITLTAAPGVAAIVGDPIGVATSKVVVPQTVGFQRLGLITPNTALNLLTRPNSQFGVFLGGTFYRNRMPYLDTDIFTNYPEMNFV